jgi:hypothetical protein
MPSCYDFLSRYVQHGPQAAKRPFWAGTKAKDYIRVFFTRELAYGQTFPCPSCDFTKMKKKCRFCGGTYPRGYSIESGSHGSELTSELVHPDRFDKEVRVIEAYYTDPGKFVRPELFRWVPDLVVQRSKAKVRLSK